MSIKVSVLLPVYNAEKYVFEAVNSILEQTFRDFEFIIINDGSTDGSLEILHQFDDPRIKIFNNPENLGLIKTLNLGLELAKGEYIARMDADDISLSDRFEKQVKYLDTHPECVLLGGNIRYFGDLQLKAKIILDPDVLKIGLLVENLFAHPTIMMRSKVVKENKIKYREELLHTEDWGFWVEISKYGSIKNLPDVLLKYRFEGQNISQKNNNTAKERFFVFYKMYYPLFLTELNKDILDVLWQLNRQKIESMNISKLLHLINRIKSELIIKGYSEDAIQDFFEIKLEQMFYSISDQSSRNGLYFLLKSKKFSFKKIYYLGVSFFKAPS